MTGTAATLLQAEVERILPPGAVAVVAETWAAAPGTLQKPERTTTGPMAPARLREFATGRACARAALRELGIATTGVPVGPNRDPLWPTGVVGSIAHSSQFAIAAVAPAGLLGGLGVDLEPATPLDDDLIDRICRPEEIARLPPEPNKRERAKLFFSAKESVYKCLWPSTRVFLDFHDVEITFDSEGFGYSVNGWGPLRNHVCNHLLGRVGMAAGHVVAVTYFRRG